tara:strand:+ start:610 stop:1314 length:705 start_codon:yes stop_codon:yes gene_type:complete
MNRERVLEFTRQNTGKHFLDSGFGNGRIWQQPAPGEGEAILLDEYPAISVTQWLVDCAEELPEIMDAFTKRATDLPEDDWFSIGRETMKHLGYVQATRGNTYNTENDLDQNFVYEIWMPEDEDGWAIEDDWLYSDEAICVMYLHTGADVRGGYSAPLAVKWAGEYPLPVYYCVEYFCEGGPGAKDGRYTCGYTHNPRYQLESDGFEFVEMVEDGLVFHRDGEKFTFRAKRPCLG